VPDDLVIFGEVGLSGEVRGVGQAELRLKEAAKLGFGRALVPTHGGRRRGSGGGRQAATSGLAIDEIAHLQDLVVRLGGA
jgi:DNA repair protein RadA/Sms